ncbi:hypothetical protein LTR95_006600 [Oleoguttula sp. CCFEE 5521]
MASQSIILANHCAVCGKDAKYRCAKCTEGLGAHGQVDINHYCGKDCQTAHWASHKGECKVKNARKQLYRAGHVLRTMTGCSEVRVQLEGFPTFGLLSFTEAKHNLGSNTGLVYRVRLSDSSSYVLDLGDAGKTREHAVMPSTEFMDEHVVTIIDSNELGNCRRGFGNMVRREIENVGMGSNVGIKEKIVLLIDRHRAHMTAAFEVATKAIDGMDTLGQLLAAPSEEYSTMKTTFVDYFETTLTEVKMKANEEGQFDLHIAAMRAAFS